MNQIRFILACGAAALLAGCADRNPEDWYKPGSTDTDFKVYSLSCHLKAKQSTQGMEGGGGLLGMGIGAAMATPIETKVYDDCMNGYGYSKRQ